MMPREPFVLPNDWIRITLTEPMQLHALDVARRFSEKTKEFGFIPDSSNFWAIGSDAENQFQNYVGELGCEALRYYLWWTDLPYHEYDTDDRFEGDKYDFKIHDLEWDLKTAWAPKNDVTKLGRKYRMFIAKHQIDKVVDGYIHVQLAHNWQYAYIIGYIMYPKAKTFPIVLTKHMKNPAVSIPFSELTPARELLEIAYYRGKDNGV